MLPEKLSDLLYLFLYWGTVAFIVILISWLLSYLLPFFKNIMQFIVSKMLEKTTWSYNKGKELPRTWLEELINQYKRLLKSQARPMVRSWLKEEEIRLKMNKLERAVKHLEGSAFPDPEEQRCILAELKALGVIGPSRSLVAHKMRFTLFVLFILAVITINTFLMSEFWASVSMGFSTYLGILNFTYANVMAMLFAIFEVGAGIVHYYVEPKDEAGDQPRFYSIIRVIVWFAIVALALIEAAAFAKISAVLNFADQLGIAKDNALYGVFDYFLAPFGFAITLVLFSAGYKLMESLEGILAVREKLGPVKRLNKYVRRLETVSEKLSSALPHNVGGGISPMVQQLQTKMEEAIQGINIYLQRQMDLLNQDVEFNNAEMWASVGRAFILSVIWIAMIFISYNIALQALDNLGLGQLITGTISLAPFVAALIAIGTGIFGFLLTRWLSENHGRPQSLQGSLPVVNRGLIGLTMFALMTVFILVGVGLASGAGAHWLTCLVGVLVLVALFLLGMFFREYLEAVILFIRVSVTYIVSLLFILLGAVLTLVRLIFTSIYLFIALLTIPGLAVRKTLFRSQDIPSTFPLLIVALMLVGSSCVPHQSGTRVFYLFDISGSFRKPDVDGVSPLRASVDFAKLVVDDLSRDKNIQGQFPQEHRIGYISQEIMNRYGKGWFTIGRATGIFNKETGTDQFRTELDSILMLPSSEVTDLYLGLYSAAEALNTASVRHKLLIIFSDLHQTSRSSSDKVDIRLDGVKVIMIHTETNEIYPDTSINDRTVFKQKLKAAGCTKILNINLTSVSIADIETILKEQ